MEFAEAPELICSGKPLGKAGEVRAARPDLKKLVLRGGRAIEAGKDAHQTKRDEPRELVPSSWQLIRRSPDGAERVLGKAVPSYDVTRDGTVIFTDGRAVHRGVSSWLVGPSRAGCRGSNDFRTRYSGRPAGKRQPYT